MMRWLSGAAAAGVVGLAVAIPAYLTWQVLPLLAGGGLQPGNSGGAEPGATLGLVFAPDGERVLRVVPDGELQVLRLADEQGGSPATIDVHRRIGGAPLTAAARFTGRSPRVVLGGRNGRILLLRWGEGGLQGDPLLAASLRLIADAPVTSLAGAQTGERAVVAALDDRDRLHLVRLSTSGVKYLRDPDGNAADGHQPLGLELSADGRWLYLPCADGTVRVVRLGNDTWEVTAEVHLDTPGLTAHAMLAGGRSLVLGAADGGIHRLFPVAAGDEPRFSTAPAVAARDGAAIEALAAARDLPVIAASRAGGGLSLHALPSRAWVHSWQPRHGETVAMALAGRRLLAMGADGEYRTWLRQPAEPLPSLRGLWRPLRYEGRGEPAYRWQPDAPPPASAGFSLTPLAFGSIKAALVGMLLAMPVGLVGAARAVTRLGPGPRGRLRAAMLTLEAVPTVVLGLLAGLWLAPLLYARLGALLFTLALLPPALALTGWLWTRYLADPVPRRWRGTVAAGMIVAVTVAAWYLGLAAEWSLFDGQLSAWLERRFGWRYDLGNALVAGFAIGVAVTPTLYVLAEDALASTPRAQYRASLALGATPGQTLTRLLLPRALPGLFGAIALAFSRAVGEAVIVLMALAATPVLAPSLLRGLQAIGPTLATDMPDAAPGSNVFRVLMAAALALFLFTLLVNLLAAGLRRGLVAGRA